MGEFHDRTTTPEWSEARAAVQSVVKTEVSFVYALNMCPHSTHTHLKDCKTEWPCNPTNTEYTPITWENSEILFLQISSIEQLLPQKNPVVTATVANYFQLNPNCIYY